MFEVALIFATRPGNDFVMPSFDPNRIDEVDSEKSAPATPTQVVPFTKILKPW